MTIHKSDVDEVAGLEDLDPAVHRARDASGFRGIVTARHDLAAAEQRLRDAVAEARAAGDSWTIIGAALDISRQAAQQRFGRA